MRFNKRRMPMIIALAIIGTSALHAQESIHRLRPLVETSARRLFLAQQVALAKWDSGTAVEDVAREAQVVESAIKDGQSKGLDPTLVSNFFKAQIEANKTVQYSLMAKWRRLGNEPVHAPVNLVDSIRPQLDQIQGTLIAELRDTAAIRESTNCEIETAEAVGEYVLLHLHEHEIATLGPKSQIQTQFHVCNAVY